MAQTFKDANLKFGIIACLNGMGLHLEEGAKIKRLKSYQRAYKEADFSDPVKAVVDYYTALDIPQEELDVIVEFCPYVSADCYNNMVKEWDGEDQRFDITCLDGIEQLRNMKVFYDRMFSLYEDVDITALLHCPALKKVTWETLEPDDKQNEVLAQLRAKGVEIIVE